MCFSILLFFFFFYDTATTEIYPLSLHDALPIWGRGGGGRACLLKEWDDLAGQFFGSAEALREEHHRSEEHTSELQSQFRISYAVFCLKKKTPPPPHNQKTDTQLYTT